MRVAADLPEVRYLAVMTDKIGLLNLCICCSWFFGRESIQGDWVQDKPDDKYYRPAIMFTSWQAEEMVSVR